LIKKKTYSHTVPGTLTGPVRLRNYLKGIFPHLETGSAVKKALQKQQILINGKLGKTGDWVEPQMKIEFQVTFTINMDSSMPIDIVYEDEYLMVVRKPPGLASSGNRRSLQQRLQSIPIPESPTSLPYPYLVHRLDKATEGILIAAKKAEVHRALNTMLAEQEVDKRYVLISEGVPSALPKFIEEPIHGMVAKTEILKVEPLGTKDATSRVYVKLHTGRTHQLRIHFFKIGHPIVGDQLYNQEGLSFKTGLLLCAYFIEFRHPITAQTISLHYPIPDKISKYQSI